MPIVEDLLVVWLLAILWFILWDVWSRRQR
jgi:hypothetical protein